MIPGRQPASQPERRLGNGCLKMSLGQSAIARASHHTLEKSECLRAPCSRREQQVLSGKPSACIFTHLAQPSTLNQEWPRQTKPKKGQFMNFSQGHSGTKVQCESCLFPKEKTPEFTKMCEIHELFVLALSLVWFAGATPESLLNPNKDLVGIRPRTKYLAPPPNVNRDIPQAHPPHLLSDNPPPRSIFNQTDALGPPAQTPPPFPPPPNRKLKKVYPKRPPRGEENGGR